MRSLRFVIGLLALIVWAVSPVVAAPAEQAGCTFTLGFRALRDQIPDIVGECLENEAFNLSNGNSEQRTTGGLLVWRKADNWTAFTNGSITWINGPEGLASRPNVGPLFPWEASVPAAAPAAPAPAPAAAPPPPPPASSPPPPATSGVGNCDPSYPDVCIPRYPPDLDCTEIPHKRFRVVGADPHRFDADKDGIGCET